MPYPVKDPLDTVMVGAICLASLASLATAGGYGRPVIGITASLLALAYFKAPRRRYPTAEAVSEGVDLAGKVCLVTGPTSGIGTETARVLALRGARVVLAARNPAKLARTKASLETSLAKRGVKAVFDTVVLDLGDLDSVRSAAASFKALGAGRLDLLVLNAGIMALVERAETKQGIEAQIGTCHVGHALLTSLLLPELKASAPSRVVVLSSSAYKFRDESFLDSPVLESEPYNEWVAYGNAKVSNMMFAKELNARHSTEGVSACSVMPGGIHTGLQGEVSLWIKAKWALVTPFFFKSIEQGAATTIKCALVEDLSGEGGGAYFENCGRTSFADKMAPAASCKKLWEATEAMLSAKL